MYKEYLTFQEAWHEASATRRLFSQYYNNEGHIHHIRQAERWFVHRKTKELWFIKESLDNIKLLSRADIGRTVKNDAFQYVHINGSSFLFSSIKLSREEARLNTNEIYFQL